MLTTGVCVFCHYKTNTWDSNGQLVTKKDATNGLYKDSKGWFRVIDGKKKRIQLPHPVETCSCKECYEYRDSQNLPIDGRDYKETT